MATCDPSVGLLAAVLARSFGVRLLPLPRPSRSALELLGQGLVHVAGVHLSRADDADGNARIVHEKLGAGFRLLRAARWEEGIALSPQRKVTSLRAALRSNLSWIGRQDGSGARQCLDELLGGKERTLRCQASDHRGVAEAVRGGCADAGVCLRLVSEEAGLDFFSVREEAYDLCFPARIENDRRIQALLQVLRSNAYRRMLSELPGYGTAETGELLNVP
jgi:molybdate-binding protein